MSDRINPERTEKLVSSKINSLSNNFPKNLTFAGPKQPNRLDLPYNYSSFFASPYIINNYFLLKLKILSSVDEYERVSQLRPANENWGSIVALASLRFPSALFGVGAHDILGNFWGENIDH